MQYVGWRHISMLKPAVFSRFKAIHRPFEELNRVKLTLKLIFREDMTDREDLGPSEARRSPQQIKSINPQSF